ncbi:hypothetical protein M413DRAFT_293592 [Hebeloma cylindrosporum]|uniref:Uncharacterized protein n=1 Tax=Hebeloma cylindrosporum TaxID=76867 RepID=A0A0C3CNY0_HEBCY|nr:hypothetical protein M413DRAFT_293592 [Hebeloma cylindrosporum h7]
MKLPILPLLLLQNLLLRLLHLFSSPHPLPQSPAFPQLSPLPRNPSPLQESHHGQIPRLLIRKYRLQKFRPRRPPLSHLIGEDGQQQRNPLLQFHQKSTLLPPTTTSFAQTEPVSALSLTQLPLKIHHHT